MCRYISFDFGIIINLKSLHSITRPHRHWDSFPTSQANLKSSQVTGVPSPHFCFSKISHVTSRPFLLSGRVINLAPFISMVGIPLPPGAYLPLSFMYTMEHSPMLI